MNCSPGTDRHNLCTVAARGVLACEPTTAKVPAGNLPPLQSRVSSMSLRTFGGGVALNTDLTFAVHVLPLSLSLACTWAQGKESPAPCALALRHCPSSGVTLPRFSPVCRELAPSPDDCVPCSSQPYTGLGQLACAEPFSVRDFRGSRASRSLSRSSSLLTSLLSYIGLGVLSLSLFALLG